MESDCHGHMTTPQFVSPSAAACLPPTSRRPFYDRRPHLRCTTRKTCRRVIARHIWEDSRGRIGSNRLTVRGKPIYARRKERVERSFADRRGLHGHRYARMHDLSKVLGQCLLCAAASNMKKIALHMSRLGLRRPTSPATAMAGMIASHIIGIFQSQKRQYAPF